MQFLDPHRRLLELAATKGLPEDFGRDDQDDVGTAMELIEAGMMTGKPVLDGELIGSPKITLAGREYLAKLDRDAWNDSAKGRAWALLTRFQNWVFVALGAAGMRLVDYLMDLLIAQLKK